MTGNLQSSMVPQGMLMLFNRATVRDAWKRSNRAGGFTLVELLIAMTITLLLMAGLAKSFAIIGESIKRGRSQVSLSSKMRGVSFRLRGDLRSRTVDAKPPILTENGSGYFMYYEGPLTEHTYALFGAEPTRTVLSAPGSPYPWGIGDVIAESDPTDSDSDGTTDYYEPDSKLKKAPTYRRLARYGDFDDYVAFTAEAAGDDWFTGKVPAYLVDDDAVDPMEPRVIRSKYAEIIIWASPVWQIDPSDDPSQKNNTLDLEPHPSGMPVYLDENNDLAPDQIVLHQRILLIRPDLNVPRTLPGPTASLSFTSNVLRPWLNNANAAKVPPAMERLYPIGEPNPVSVNAPLPPPTPLLGSYVNVSSSTNNQLMLSSNWLVGMTPLHHFFDLSLRRIVHPTTGEPTGYVAANSLKDLVQPHHRFAHVRYPGRYMGLGNFSSSSPANDAATSMPLLALGWNDSIFRWQFDDGPDNTPNTADDIPDPRGPSQTPPS